MLKISIFLILSIIILGVSSFARVNARSLSPIVQTPLGPVQGLFEDNTPGVYSFKGVPFAQPPVGNLRFADPVAPIPWNATINATAFSPGCMAYCPSNAFPKPAVMCTPTVSEDCLYLNIFTPTLNPNANLDVIVFFNGGNFQFGSGGVTIYDGSALAKNQNVVSVTINYRLNVFGGLFTGRLKGNYMLKDQRESMKWIQKNIAAFGGNPKSLTISGQSAGAFSVTTHMASPKSWPYFQKAFSISNPIGLMATTPELAMQLGNIILKNVSCPESGSDEQLACLRALPAETLLAASANRLAPLPKQALMIMMDWVPVVDGDELPSQPITAFENGNFNRVPFLSSTVSNESLQFIYDISGQPLSKLGMEALLLLVLDNMTLFEAAVAQYGPIPNIPDERHFIAPAITDYLFYCPWLHYGRKIAERGVPMYEWLYDNQRSTWNAWTYGSAMPYCSPSYINCHAVDLVAYFDPLAAVVAQGIAPPSVSPAEQTMVNNYQTALANFMKTGNPNQPKAVPVTFPLMGPDNKIVNMTENIAILDGYRATGQNSYCSFWDRAGYRRF